MPSLAFVLAFLATAASLAAIAPLVVGAICPGLNPSRPVTAAFVGFGVWTIYGALVGSGVVVATSAVFLILCALVLSTRALLGVPR